MSVAIMVLAVPLVTIVCITIIVGISTWRRGGGARHDRRRAAEEAALIQDIYRGLQRMEERVEALETILIEQDSDGVKK